MVVLCGYATVRTPDVRRHGWHEFAPTTLIAGLAATSDRTGRGLMGVAVGSRASPRSLGEWWECRRQDFAEVMRRRMRDDRTWGWQARWYVRRALRERPPDIGSLVVMPERWPRGEPIPAFSGGLSRWDLGARLNGCVLDRHGRWPDGEVVLLSACEEPARTVRVGVGLSVRGVRVWDRVIEHPIVISGRGAECLLCDRTDGTSEDVRSALRPRLELTDAGEVRLKVHDRNPDPAWLKIECGVYARLIVRVDGRIVGRGHTGTAWAWPVERPWRTAAMIWEPGAHQKMSEPGVRITISAEGDPEQAWLAYKDNPFDKPSAGCWTGRFEVGGTLDELSVPGEESGR